MPIIIMLYREPFVAARCGCFVYIYISHRNVLGPGVFDDIIISYSHPYLESVVSIKISPLSNFLETQTDISYISISFIISFCVWSTVITFYRSEQLL